MPEPKEDEHHTYRKSLNALEKLIMLLIVLKEYFNNKEVDRDLERVIDVPEARELVKRFEYLEWKLYEKMSQEITLSFKEMSKVENEERDDPLKKSIQGALY